MEYRFMGDQVMDDGVVIISGVERERAREMTIGRMKCMSCKEEYFEEKAGTCKECYDEASETEEELKKEIEELRANISFLRLSPPHSSLSQHFSDLQIETPCGRCIPAHKAVLPFLDSYSFKKSCDSSLSKFWVCQRAKLDLRTARLSS
ncbi:hypothetical protein AMTRI_Chr11g157040 [Amborella trichopoda]